MATVNRKGTRTATPNAGSPLRTVAAGTTTFEGAPAYTRDAKSDLFLLAVSNFFGEDTFYEKDADRKARFEGLVRTVAAQDPAWMLRFVPWLRDKANIRTAAVVAAVEAAKVMLKADQAGSDVGPARQLLRNFFEKARPDEPAEALAYWLQTYGRKLPGGIRRGIADGAALKFNEGAFVKWNSDGKAVHMADVIELCHPTPKAPWQSTLFKYILDSRRDPKVAIPEELQLLRNRAQLLALSAEDKAQILAAPYGEAVGIAGLPMLPPEAILQGAGMTWEQVSSWGKMTAQTWDALIPVMGYMALLRNLRNFQQAGISAAAVKLVTDRLSNPDEVARSRQLPFRFLSAYRNADSPLWTLALETALQHSAANIPALPGRSLVLVDTSGSMVRPMSAKSTVNMTTVGALFGIALAAKGEQVDLYGFDNNVWEHKLTKGGGVLRSVEAFDRKVRGGGTETAKAVATTFKGHNRVIIITDEQTFGPNRGFWQGDVSSQIPKDVPMYSFNLAGYAPAMLETSSTRHQLGGLTDNTFSMIPLIEAGQRAKWPWETPAV